MHRSCACLILIVSVGVCGSGCSSGSSGAMPSLLPVKGKVFYKGKPMTQGVVTFEPDGYGRPASGKLQPDGSFALLTLGKEGVVPGHHRVFITDVDKSLARDRNFKKNTAASTTKLTAEVTAEKTEFTFEIE